MSTVSTTRGVPGPGYARHPGSIWIDKHRPNLPNKRWVASDGLRKVAEDISIGGLMDQIKAQELDPGDVAIAYITSESA